MLGGDRPAPEPRRGRPTVVLFVGLQGAGKTTTCAKYAYLHKRRGFRPAMVCADTFRAGAFDQLKQNATKAQVPFYGSYSETDPASIAAAGVRRFRAEKRDLILVDTSGRHRQEEALFEEMRAVAEAVRPDLVVFVMDGSIGQAAHDQAKAFHDAVDVGEVIVTKLDGHAKGGGALSAVAATGAPVAYLGTGEHLTDLERFEAPRFVGRLLGRGDWAGLLDKLKEMHGQDRGGEGKGSAGSAGSSSLAAAFSQQETLDKLQRGEFTPRLMYEQFQGIQKMGPINQLMQMLPGFSNAQLPAGPNGEDSALAMRRMMTIMDSMTERELDCADLKVLAEPSRVLRWSRGSGIPLPEVRGFLERFAALAKTFTAAMKNFGKMPKGRGGNDPRAMQQQMAQMAKGMPPQFMQMLGGQGGMQQLMKQLEGGGAGGMPKGLF